MSIKKTPEYRLRANKKYKTKCKQYILVVNPKIDPDVIEKLDSVENRSGYIKELIRKDLDTNCKVRHI